MAERCQGIRLVKNIQPECRIRCFASRKAVFYDIKDAKRERERRPFENERIYHRIDYGLHSKAYPWFKNR